MPQPTLDDSIERALIDLLQKKGIAERTKLALDDSSIFAQAIAPGDETLLTQPGRINRQAQQNLRTAIEATQQYNDEGVYNLAKRKYSEKIDLTYTMAILGEYQPRQVPDDKKKIVKFTRLVRALKQELIRTNRNQENIARILQQSLGIQDPKHLLGGASDFFKGAKQLIEDYTRIIAKAYEEKKKDYDKLVDQAVKDNNIYALATATLITNSRRH